MTKQQQAKLANEIVNRLFSNGEGESAKRLVLELEDGRNGGGWCKASVRDQVIGALAAREKHLNPGLAVFQAAASYLLELAGGKAPWDRTYFAQFDKDCPYGLAADACTEEPIQPRTSAAGWVIEAATRTGLSRTDEKVAQLRN